jgi:hypothetical protein
MQTELPICHTSSRGQPGWQKQGLAGIRPHLIPTPCRVVAPGWLVGSGDSKKDRTPLSRAIRASVSAAGAGSQERSAS